MPRAPASDLPQTASAIESLIPHAGSMSLLDCVLECDSDHIVCLASNHRQNDNPLRNTEGLPVSAALEYAAQAVAVQGGIMTSNTTEIRAGYLAVLSDVIWHLQWLHDIEGDLRIEVKRNTESSGGVDCSFCVSSDNSDIASGSLMIAFIP